MKDRELFFGVSAPKQNLIKTLLVLGLFSVPQLVMSELLEELKNPDFEVVLDEGVADWEFHTDPASADRAKGVATEAKVFSDTENFQSGAASARIEHEGPRWATLRQQVSVEPGKKYRLGVYVKAESPGPDVRIAARLLSRSGGDDKVNQPETPIFVQSGADWKHVVVEFTVGDSLSSEDRVILELRAIPPSEKAVPLKVWFDNVTIEAVE